METTSEAQLSRASAPGAAGRLAAGTVLRGRFTIERMVGPSALGEIYRAADNSDGKPVLVKLLARDYVREMAVRIRLQQDAAIAAQLDHRNVAACHGFFTEGEFAFLVGEPVDGPTLRQMLEKKRESGRGFSLKGAYNVVTHLCNALEYAHGAQLHGLLSLDTVYVNGAGRVKIAEFGLARALAPQEKFRNALGLGITSMAPEFFAPGQPDRRADIYSVGALMFELLAGRSRENEGEKLSAIFAGGPPALDAVIDRCLHALPDDRFNDAQALRTAIHAATEGALNERSGPVSAGPPASPVSAGPSGRPPPPPSGAPRAPLPPAPPPSLPKPKLAQPALAAPASLAPSWSAAPLTPSLPPSAGGLPPSALSAVDDAHERWLIQKDKLDLGPFKLADVKAQIEGGKILGQHMIVDMENGSRMRVNDHPLLREFVQRAEGELQTMRELEQVQAEQRARSKRNTMILALFGTAVIVVGGAIGIYIYKSQPQTQTKVVYVDKEGGSDDFKITDISMKVDPPAPHKKSTGPHHHPGGKNAAGEFDSATNLGDASEGGGDETLPQETVQKVMQSSFGVLKGCILEEKRRNPSTSGVEFDFIIKGSGQVSAVKANGQTSSPLASCIYGKMQSVQFPKFNGSKTHASFSLALK